MPAAQGTFSPLLPTTEVSEMGTDVVVVPCGARGCGMQVCVISVCILHVRQICCVCARVSTAAPGSDLCLSVFICHLARANTLAAWLTVVCLRDEARLVCLCILQPAVNNDMHINVAT